MLIGPERPWRRITKLCARLLKDRTGREQGQPVAKHHPGMVAQPSDSNGVVINAEKTVRRIFGENVSFNVV